LGSIHLPPLGNSNDVVVNSSVFGCTSYHALDPANLPPVVNSDVACSSMSDHVSLAMILTLLLFENSVGRGCA
jgi:hypothetical protein